MACFAVNPRIYVKFISWWFRKTIYINTKLHIKETMQHLFYFLVQSLHLLYKTKLYEKYNICTLSEKIKFMSTSLRNKRHFIWFSMVSFVRTAQYCSLYMNQVLVDYFLYIQANKTKQYSYNFVLYSKCNDCTRK
jgi:hypothetical protein